MKLATIRDGTRDGTLIVVSKDGQRYARATAIAPTLQAALDRWEPCAPALRAMYESIEDGSATTRPLDVDALGPPLPRAYEWVDGSAYINHIVLVRKARNAEPPETLASDPMVYQGGSGVLLGPRDPMRQIDPAYGLDFESEVCVILGDTPQGVSKANAGQYVRLLMLANDITLRNLIPTELAKGFGFFNSKPATAFSPFAVTPDELGPHFVEGRVHLRLRTHLNDKLVGDPDAGPEMHFSFLDLIAHITKTRAFTAGTILGSGTVSNENEARGVSCLAERRMREVIRDGTASTPFLAVGDRVRIEMRDEHDHNVFGTIEQEVITP